MVRKGSKTVIRFLCLLILSSVLIAAGTTTAAAIDWWPMFQHDQAHTGTTSSAVPLTNQTLWVKTLGGAVRSGCAVLDGVVYVGCFGGNVYALDAYTGATIWTFSAADSVWGTLAVANGKVYFGSNDAHIYCLDAGTGTEVWNMSTSGQGDWSSVAVVNNTVYIGSCDDNIYALDAATGAKIWNYTTGNQVRGSPVVSNGVVYDLSEDGSFYALDASTGAKLWSSPTGNVGTYTDSSPTIANGIVYIGSTDDNVYAFDAATGTKVWNYKTGDAVSSSPVVLGGILYIGSADGNVYALNANTGGKVWSYPTGGPVYAPPVVAGNIAFIGAYSGSNQILALDAATGAKVWSYTAGEVFAQAAIANGVLYIGSYDSNLYAFGNQTEPLSNSTPSPTSSPTQPAGGEVTKTAWVPAPANGVAACVVSVGAATVAVVLFSAAASVPASAAGGFFDKVITEIRNLIPDTIKKWLEDFVASKRKLKIDEKKGSPFLPTNAEVAVYATSVLILTFSFAYVKVINLDQFLTVLPTFFATSILVALTRTYIISLYARRKGVWTEYKLWYFGAALFLISSVALKSPFSSPTRTVHHSHNFTERLGGFLAVAGVLITLGFGGLFFILLKAGVVLIGGTGLAMCLIAAFFDTFPIEPMGGRDIYKYNKKLWAVLFLGTLVLYAAWIAHVF